MGENVRANGNHEVALNVKDIGTDNPPTHNSSSASRSIDNNNSTSCISVPFLQKMIAEVLGTYFLIFAGCGVAIVNTDKDKVITFPGVAIVWGLVVMVMIYSVGHISGAHFNPAVTIAFATCRRFPWIQVPAYVICQMVGATLASGTLRLVFNGHQAQFAGTTPAGSDLQSFVIEFIITFYLMFVISGVATDNRAIGELAGLAIGATILLNVMFAGYLIKLPLLLMINGSVQFLFVDLLPLLFILESYFVPKQPISGASMNPARTLGPAIVANRYKGVWVYMVGPIAGAIAGAWVYNLIRFTDKPLREITKSGSFLKAKGSSVGRNSSSHR